MRQFNHIMKGLGLLAMCAADNELNRARRKACGGFFCNPGLFNGQPTIQTGERILFTVEDDNIRPMSRSISMVLRRTSPGLFPCIGAGGGRGYRSGIHRARNVTRPQFQVDFEVAANCNFYPNTIWENEWSEGGGEGGEFVAEADEGYVNVLGEGKAGPYNYEIVESNNSALLVAWLNENDYEQPPEALPLIEHYVEEMKFVAVKLNRARPRRHCPSSWTSRSKVPVFPLYSRAWLQRKTCQSKPMSLAIKDQCRPTGCM